MKTRRTSLVQLKNERVQLGFDRQARLCGLRAPDRRIVIPIDHGHLTAAWAIQLRNAGGRIWTLTPGSLPTLAVQDHTLTARWRARGAGGYLDVVGTVVLRPGAAVSEWTLQIKNHTACAIWQVDYPRLSGLTAFRGLPGPDWLAAPFQMGEKNPNPVAFVNTREKILPTWARQEYGCFDVEGGRADMAFSYPGMWTMQFLAYGHPRLGGLYFAAHDGQALYKRFGMYADGGDGRHAALVMKQYPADRTAAGGMFESFYPTMVGIYGGDWWGASALYRDWAVQQLWCRQGPTRRRADIPRWAKNTDLWYWNWQFATAGHPDQVVPAIRYLKQKYHCNMAFHWYGCDGTYGGWAATRSPEIYPVNRDNRNILLRGVHELHAAGVPCIPYIQGRRWGEDSESFKRAHGLDWIAVDENGRPSEAVNKWRHTMCPTAPCHHRILRKATLDMVDKCGMDGAYLDVISSCFSVPCFNRKHDHPPGGHDHWRRGYRTNLIKIRRALKQRSVNRIITSESVIECFQDLFDLDLAREISHLSGSIGQTDSLPIPLFHSVYHDYHLTYGTVSTFIEPLPAKFRFAEALCLVGGTQLMVSGFLAHDERKEKLRPYLDYLHTLVDAHRAARRWLNLGEWKPPAGVACARVSVPISDTLPPKRNIPAIVNGCFKLGRTLGLVLVNHTDRSQRGSVTLRPADYGLAGRAWVLKQIYPARKSMRRNGGLIRLPLRMAPAAAEIWILSPDVR